MVWHLNFITLTRQWRLDASANVVFYKILPALPDGQTKRSYQRDWNITAWPEWNWLRIFILRTSQPKPSLPTSLTLSKLAIDTGIGIWITQKKLRSMGLKDRWLLMSIRWKGSGGLYHLGTGFSLLCWCRGFIDGWLHEGPSKLSLTIIKEVQVSF